MKNVSEFDKELNRLEWYMDWVIKRLICTDLGFRMKIYSKHGYIEDGKKLKELPNFDQWKKLYL